MDHIRTGDAGEEAAAAYLAAAGYRILDRKFRARTGEIDIVAMDGKTMVFVEVKTRRGLGFGTPAEAVTARKQAKIIATAFCYLKHTAAGDVPFRLDVMEVWLEKDDKTRFNHIVNAFGR